MSDLATPAELHELDQLRLEVTALREVLADVIAWLDHPALARVTSTAAKGYAAIDKARARLDDTNKEAT